jgi:hypothetical protein
VLDTGIKKGIENRSKAEEKFSLFKVQVNYRKEDKLLSYFY